ncbi:MAG: alpha/beta fold hydrolase [Actinobacteria bacterium]|nr:alpha/beta fold hydrolase [Actinomycetota bacterium]
MGMSDPARPTIVLIHGLWMTPRSWEGWIGHYQARGHLVIAPSWPGLEGEVEALNADPSPLRGLGIRRIVDHYESIVRALDAPPIIMGHSFGGAFTQILLDRGLGAAGVAIDSAPVKGVLTLPLSTLRTAFPVLKNPANRNKAVPLTLEQFHWRFTNHTTLDATRPLYERYHVPAAGRVLFEQAFANMSPKAASTVNFANATRAPLLFIAGGNDHVSPPKLNRANAAKYRKRSAAITDYREFPGRSHWTVAQDGWEAVADFALAWSLEQVASQAKD